MKLATVFLHFARRSWGAIVGWGVMLAVLGLYLMRFYDTLAEQRAMLEQLVAQYPPALMAFFGGTAEMFTAGGYLSLEFFSYMPIVIGVYAVLLGSGMLVSDEENGTLDLVLAHPISRTLLFAGRLLGAVAILAAILLLTWAGFVIGAQGTTLGVTPLQMLRPFVALFALLFLFAALSFFLSMMLPSRREKQSR